MFYKNPSDIIVIIKNKSIFFFKEKIVALLGKEMLVVLGLVYFSRGRMA